MNRLNIAPTRSNLIQTRETLDLAREGHDILDKKREVLTNELIRIAHEASRLQARVQQALAEAYQALDIARLDIGREHLEWASLSVNKTIEVDIRLRSIMGVVVPEVEGHGTVPDLPYGMGNTTVALDEASQRFRDVVEMLPDYAEIITTVWRLARELQKTQRRVNALEHVFIPQYEETADYIESTLEERERQETFRLKRIKSLTQSS
jgi:V/A-type H+-transporting ATPase subunit D